MEAREMEPNYVNSRIGEKIKDLRNKNGLTQQELADRAELTKGDRKSTRLNSSHIL